MRRSKLSRGDARRILGLSAAWSERELRARFRRLVLELHPDRRGGDASDAARLRDVVRAYEALTGRSRAATRAAPSTPPPAAYRCATCGDGYEISGPCTRCDHAPPPSAVAAYEAALDAHPIDAEPSPLARHAPAMTMAGLVALGLFAWGIHVPIAAACLAYGLGSLGWARFAEREAAVTSPS